MVLFSIDPGRQTDAAVADHSKRNQEGFIRQDTLGRMMIRHLAHQQSAFFSGPLKDDELFAFGNAGLGELDGGIGYGESSKEVGAFQHGPPGIKHHWWFSGAVWVAFHCFRCNEVLPTLPIAHAEGGAMLREVIPEASGRQLIHPNLMVMLDIVKGG